MLMTGPVIEEVSELALKTLRSDVLGVPLPPDPFEKSLLAVENPDNYAGD